MHTEKIHTLELSMVEMNGDIKHIREKIDNGLFATITKIWDKLNVMAIDRAKIETIVDNNSSFIEKIKSAMVRVSIFSVAGGAIMIAWKFVHAFIINSS